MKKWIPLFALSLLLILNVPIWGTLGLLLLEPFCFILGIWFMGLGLICFFFSMFFQCKEEDC